jgi:putative transposase
MKNSHVLLETGGHYHIFNHAVGKDNIFREDDNYLFFLRKLPSRITPFADVLAYCLMPNHFHFVFRIKDHEVLMELWRDKLKKLESERALKKLSLLPWNALLDQVITTQFANLFNSYVQSYNKKYSRQGTLLKESFQRKRIDTSEYLLKLICYVHNNPVEHGFSGEPGDWKFSSYNAILKTGMTHVMREDVLELFGGRGLCTGGIWALIFEFSLFVTSKRLKKPLRGVDFFEGCFHANKSISKSSGI